MAAECLCCRGVSGTPSRRPRDRAKAEPSWCGEARWRPRKGSGALVAASEVNVSVLGLLRQVTTSQGLKQKWLGHQILTILPLRWGGCHPDHRHCCSCLLLPLFVYPGFGLVRLHTSLKHVLVISRTIAASPLSDWLQLGTSARGCFPARPGCLCVVMHVLGAQWHFLNGWKFGRSENTCSRDKCGPSCDH